MMKNISLTTLNNFNKIIENFDDVAVYYDVKTGWEIDVEQDSIGNFRNEKFQANGKTFDECISKIIRDTGI